MAKRYTVDFNAKITPVKPINDEFTLCKCYVMALNKNRNLSYISKKAVENAMGTIYNIPVIGHLYVDDDGNYHMGGHDYTMVKDSNGNLAFKSLCVPYGVVPHQDGICFEDITESNGDVHTYLVCDAILWTGRFPELKEAIYDQETYFGQSMEINVLEHKPLDEDKNYTNICNYTYSALCLLGKSDNPDHHTEPCFPMSRVDPYEFALDDKFTELMSQLRDELATCFEKSGKGGENMDETTNVVTEQVDSAESSAENIDLNEETSVELNGDSTPSENDAAGIDENSAEDSNDEQLFSSTYREKHEAVIQALPHTCERNENGNLIHTVDYYLCDLDDAYAYVERYEWTRDDNDSCCHVECKGRLSYAYSDVDKTAAITGEFEEMIVKWLTKEEASKIENMRSQYEELVEYKSNREKEDRNAEFDVAISEFTDCLSGNEEFDEVYKNRYSYDTIEALKDACYLIKGKFSIAIPQKKNANEPSVPVGVAAPVASLHQRFHARYGKNN